jgi:hypothetical protein
MKFEFFTQNHWNIFLNHICQFHPLTTDFIEKYEAELQWALLHNNTAIQLDDEFTRRLKHSKHPEWKPFKNDQPILDEEIENLEEYIKGLDGFRCSKRLYEEFIIPNLAGSRFLEDIFEKRFDLSQRYFIMTQRKTDEHGHLPMFQFADEKLNEKLNNEEKLTKLDKDPVVKGQTGYNGKPRLNDVLYFYLKGGYTKPLPLISKNVKTVLEQFNIGPHQFIKVDLKPHKISTDLDYYLFENEKDSFLQHGDFDKIQFTKQISNLPIDMLDEEFRKKFNIPDPEVLERGWIKNYEQLNQETNLAIETGSNSEITPDQFHSQSDLDIFTISTGRFEKHLIVNEFVRTCIQKLFPNQFLFESTHTLKIRIPQDIYDAKREPSYTLIELKKSVPKLSKEFVKQQEKIDRLKSGKTGKFLSVEADEFEAIQKKLRVVIPEKMKVYLRSTSKDFDYKILPIDQYYLDVDFAEFEPKVYNSLIIAENGLGDLLGLILEKNSDFLLQETVYEFNHETGKIRKFG